MKFLRTFVYSFLTLGALASQCEDAKKYGESLDTGNISYKCDSNGKVTELKLTHVIINKDDVKIISKFTNAQKIEFNGCEYVDSLDSSYFEDFSELTYLSVKSELPAFKYAKNLKTLEINGNTSVDRDDIKIISEFTELEKLKIDVREVSEKHLSYLESLKHLKELKLVDERSEDNLCDYVPNEIKSICYPKASTTETKTTATSVIVESNDELVSIKGSTEVKEVKLYRIFLDQSGVDALATLTGLETVEFVDCDYDSSDLNESSLKNIKNLRKLIANSRQDVRLFKNNDSLKSLTVYGNTSLENEDIKIIAGFTQLEKLEINVRAIYATDFSSLKNLTHLKELKIEDSLSDVNFCQKLPSELRSLCKTSYTTKKSSTKTTKTTKTSTKKTTKKTTTKTTRTTKITKTKTTKTTKKNNSLPTNSTDKCGKGVAICKEGYCCSKYGYCGKSDDYCKSSRGCQSEFGHCE
ncbi:RNI-like protein [Neocallimastix sp. 'constans']